MLRFILHATTFEALHKYFKVKHLHNVKCFKPFFFAKLPKVPRQNVIYNIYNIL